MQICRKVLYVMYIVKQKLIKSTKTPVTLFSAIIYEASSM